MKLQLLMLSLVTLCLVTSCAKSRRVLEKPIAPQTETTHQQQEPNNESESDPDDGLDVQIREERVTAIEASDDVIKFRYYVIIGSFRSRSNAQRFETDIERKGFQTVILENEASLYRVSVGAFNVEAEARNLAARIRLNHPNHSDVWLLLRTNP